MLLAHVRDALAMDERARQQAATRADNARRLALLTTRERQVLNLLVGGKTSKEIATSLGVSVRTVEGHRARTTSRPRSPGRAADSRGAGGSG
jgi:two-component system response regulator DctR